MANDGQIEVDAGTGSIFVDTSVVTTGEGAGQNRQRVAIGDAVQGENFLSIGADGASSVHVIPSGTAASVVVSFPAVQPVSQSGAWSASVDGTVVATQGGAPWTVDALQQGNWGASISNVVPVSQSGAWAASVDGTVVATQGGAWTVNAQQQGNYGASISNFPASQAVTQGTVPWAASVEGQVGVTQVTSPWVTSGTATVSGSVSAIQTGTWFTTVSGSVTALPSGNQTVSGSVSVLNQSGSASVQLLPSSSDIGYVGTWTTSGPVTGQSSASVTTIQMTATSSVPINGILVGGVSSNVYSVWAGASGVASVGATGGVEVQPGGIVPFTCGNVNQIYIVGSNNTDIVWWSVL